MRMSLTLFADQELGSHWLAALPLWMHPQLVDRDNDHWTLIKRCMERKKNEDNGDGIEIKHMCVCVLTKFTVDQQYSVYASIIISLYLGVQNNHRSRRKDNIHKEWTLVYCSCTCRWVHMCPCGCGGSSSNTTADTNTVCCFSKFGSCLKYCSTICVFCVACVHLIYT